MNDSLLAPQVIHETILPTSDGAIIYDASVIRSVSARTFTSAGWQSVRPVEDVLHSGGRGNTLILSDDEQEYVLRHYRRGGLVGRVIRDAYFWTGEDRTRPFAEWRILQKLANAGLRVPRPAVARYCRRGLTYSADIITVRVPGIRSLSATLLDRPLSRRAWLGIGEEICRFHLIGVNHADLNAHNVQIGERGLMWLLDFDKARIMPAGPWRQRNLDRLHRSLVKLRSQDQRFNYGAHCWEALLEGYFQASRSA